MIRFILKTIEERPMLYTVDVKNNDFAPLNDVLIGAKYEIIGAEHFVEFDEVIVGDMRITSKGISFAGDSEPKFPEKYTPVIVRDEDDEVWRPRLFIKTRISDRFCFETSQMSYNKIAPLAGNEHLIEQTKKPPFYWMAENGKPRLVKS